MYIISLLRSISGTAAISRSTTDSRPARVFRRVASINIDNVSEFHRTYYVIHETVKWRAVEIDRENRLICFCPEHNGACRIAKRLSVRQCHPHNFNLICLQQYYTVLQQN